LQVLVDIVDRGVAHSPPHVDRLCASLFAGFARHADVAVDMALSGCVSRLPAMMARRWVDVAVCEAACLALHRLIASLCCRDPCLGMIAQLELESAVLLALDIHAHLRVVAEAGCKALRSLLVAYFHRTRASGSPSPAAAGYDPWDTRVPLDSDRAVAAEVSKSTVKYSMQLPGDDAVLNVLLGGGVPVLARVAAAHPCNPLVLESVAELLGFLAASPCCVPHDPYCASAVAALRLVSSTSGAYAPVQAACREALTRIARSPDKVHLLA
jgi:hypothetical protein